MDDRPPQHDGGLDYAARGGAGHSPGQHVDTRPQGYAITALVLGILAIVGCFCYGLPGLVFGVPAIVFGRLAQKDDNQGGDGLALAGLICGIVGTSLGTLYALLMIGMFGLLWAGSSQPTPPPAPGPATPAPLPTVGADLNYDDGYGVTEQPDEVIIGGGQAEQAGRDGRDVADQQPGTVEPEAVPAEVGDGEPIEDY